MLAVIVCNLCAAAMLVGLLAGIVAGFVRARARIGEALAFEPLTVSPRRAAAARPARAHPA